MKSLLVFVLSLVSTITFAQNNLLKGMITYQNTGVPVKDASIRFLDKNSNSVYSDEEGKFSLEINEEQQSQLPVLVVKKEKYRLVETDNPILANLSVSENKAKYIALAMVKEEEFNQRKENYENLITEYLNNKKKVIKSNAPKKDDGIPQSIEHLPLFTKIHTVNEDKEALAISFSQIDLNQALDLVVEAMKKFEHEKDVEAVLKILDHTKLEKLPSVKS